MTQLRITKNIPCPCHGCNERTMICHSENNCTKDYGYPEYRAELDKHLTDLHERNRVRENAFSAALLRAVRNCIKSA